LAVVYDSQLALTGDHKSPDTCRLTLTTAWARWAHQDLSELDPLTGVSGATPDRSVSRSASESVPLSAGRRSDVVRRQMHYPGSNRG
jgi:hypothetical protein